MTRDPRINPQVGDIVRNTKGLIREVHDRRGNDITYVKVSGERRTGPHVCWITTWMGWCNKGEVVHTAEVYLSMEEHQ